jgi:hypothetical protein
MAVDDEAPLLGRFSPQHQREFGPYDRPQGRINSLKGQGLAPNRNDDVLALQPQRAARPIDDFDIGVGQKRLLFLAQGVVAVRCDQGDVREYMRKNKASLTPCVCVPMTAMRLSVTSKPSHIGQ